MKIKLFTIPNIVTLSNLTCGCLSIVSSLVYEDVQVAAALVVLAAVFDFFDGFTARLLKQYSEIGVQLDSLADMVSFGVAPSMALYAVARSVESMYGLEGGFAEFLRCLPFLIAAFSALRLAKFNIDDTQHDTFCGLPTPGNAIFCISLAALATMGKVSLTVEWIALISILMSALLVSPIRMFSFKFKSFGLRENLLRYLFLLVSIILIISIGIYSVPSIIVLYVVVSAVQWICCRSKE
ncbi:MAG: CDP-diacylglycerol--serine O-phosphatidyltransferase [Alistipes sp.]|nr:CDP-diacylglycerol--serine O-phosphatidyltransferase [Alistipes sp.]